VPGRPSRRRAPAAGPGESQPRARRDDAGVKKELAETNNGRGNLRAQHCLFRRCLVFKLGTRSGVEPDRQTGLLPRSRYSYSVSSTDLCPDFDRIMRSRCVRLAMSFSWKSAAVVSISTDISTDILLALRPCLQQTASSAKAMSCSIRSSVLSDIGVDCSKSSHRTHRPSRVNEMGAVKPPGHVGVQILENRR
jgi:hypothetical protein